MKLNLIWTILFAASVALASAAEDKPTESAPAETTVAPQEGSQPEVATKDAAAADSEQGGDGTTQQQRATVGTKVQNGLKHLISAAGTAQQHIKGAKNAIKNRESTKAIQKDLNDILHQAKSAASEAHRKFQSSEQGAALEQKTRNILARTQELIKKIDNSEAGKKIKADLNAINAQAQEIVKQVHENQAVSKVSKGVQSLVTEASQAPSKLNNSLESGAFAKTVDSGINLANQHAKNAAGHVRNVAGSIVGGLGRIWQRSPSSAPAPAPAPAKAPATAQ